MRLGLTLGYFGSASGVAGAARESLALTREAESLGYSVVWASEAYGSDAATVLAWLAAQTTRIDVGSAVLQIPARSPAATAMTAATLDGLSGGRFRLGLGVSGPQVSEGWHGVRFAAPLARTREYVEVVRMALARRPVQHEGRHHPLPLPDGPGIPLRLALPQPRPDLPLYLAAVGPRNTALAGEVADGWLPVFFSPEHSADQMALLAEGLALAAPREGAPAFDVAPTVPLVVTAADGPAGGSAGGAAGGGAGGGADEERMLAPLRGHVALYLGGMGSRDENFYHRLAVAMGHEEEADAVQDLYLDGRRREAAAAVPQGFLDSTCLIGGPGAIRDRMIAYAEAGVTTLSVSPMGPDPEQRLASLRVAAEALEAAGVAS